MTISKAEPRFDIDLKYGQQAEFMFDEFLHWIADGNGAVEVKRKRYLDHRIYVETHHDPGRRGHYVPSGINTTAAHLWAFVLGDTGIHIAIPTDLLREALNDPSTRDREEQDGSCPTRGRLVDFCLLLFRLNQRTTAKHDPLPDDQITDTNGAEIDHAPLQITLTAKDIPWGR